MDEDQGASAYVTALARWGRLVQGGASHSGRERNSCFLNTGSGRFADVSAASGLDFLDDGRAVAPIDWDHDGDLDLWLANRTGPQLRFLRNETEPDGSTRYLEVRLVGREANRDGIGARLELVFADPAEPRRVRTLRAGDGFLTQTTKWVHFGLGDAGRIDRMDVRWPGGPVETFRGLEPGGRYRLAEGSGRAEPQPAPRRALAIEPSPAIAAESSGAARIWLTTRVPAPLVRALDLEGNELRLTALSGRPLLLNFWASWCAPCRTELAELSRRRPELARLGLAVVALSVDGLGDERSAEPAALLRLLEDVDFSLVAGRAPAETVDKLELLFTELFGRHVSFPVPTSLLIDAGGTVAAIYLGAIDVDRLLIDARQLDVSDDERRRLGDPFPGRWYTPVGAVDLSLMARRYLRAHYVEDALRLLRRLAQAAPGDADSRRELATALIEGEQYAEAVSEFREVARLRPRSGRAHDELATALLRQGKPESAAEQFRLALELEPDNAGAHFNLATLLRATGDDAGAARHHRAALRLRPDWPPPAAELARLLATSNDPTLRDPAEAIALAERACRATEERVPELLSTLAAAYASAGRFDEAIDAEHKAHRLATSADRADLAQQIEARLRHYESERRGDP